MEKYGSEVSKSTLRSIYGPSDEEIYGELPTVDELVHFM